jgi:hypothetical protein
VLDANAWVTFVFQVLGLIVISIGALWAYTRYALERGLLAPAQFTIESAPVGPSADVIILEVLLRLKNVGSSTLIARNIRVDIRYLNEDDEIVLFDDPEDVRFGRVRFKHSLYKEMFEGGMGETVLTHGVQGLDQSRDPGGVKRGRGFLLLPYDTFVQPGVDQVYTFATSLPNRCRYVLIWASFEYAQDPSLLQRIILRLSRLLGLIQYSLLHLEEPHTVERVFRVGDFSSP